MGTIPISGAKNAALPLMIASLLTDETLTLENVPRLRDVQQLFHILSNHGTDWSVEGKRAGQDDMTGQTVHLCARAIVDTTAPYELVSTMRASFWVIGPLVARMGVARVSLPGGCAIDLPRVSVGATHTLMMAATLARGETLITNAAREPEVVDLANCLIAMGAKIEGAGTSEISIQGVERLRGARHRVLPDRIETGTYAMAVAMTGGDVTLEHARGDLLTAALATLERAGAEITETNRGLRIRRNGAGIAAVDVATEPFPGFPTDLQAQFMALMTTARGTSRITETIFENRFMHVQELARLGARITLSGQMARIEGVDRLKGAPVMATDLRASVSLVIAGLVAEGETTINRVYHLDRGFERLEDKLGRCGADIERISS